MNDETHNLITTDTEQIREGLSTFAEYSFSADLRKRMKAQKLSSLSLGDRCLISHTIVDNWKQNKARPNGKERVKELGLALGMGEQELNAFLYQNGYPKLYAKNPLDSAAKVLLLSGCDCEKIVSEYRSLIDRHGLRHYAPPSEIEPLKTYLLSAALRSAAEKGQISGWFREHEKHFVGGEKTQMPDLRIIRFLLLFFGDLSIHEMVATGEIPAVLERLLYDLSGGRAVSVRGLREKLIAFGLYSNMTEEEIDTLLSFARLRLISDPATAADFAVLSALRVAHERYAFFEANNLDRIVKRLSASTDEYDQAMLTEYKKRLENTKELTKYYDDRPRTPEETVFEKHYTSFSDHCVMDYVLDVLLFLTETRDLTDKQIKPYATLLQRTQEGEPEWN